jgi:acetolactate synthase-1/2/3 large subunit
MCPQIRVADYIAKFLVQNDISDVFTVTGGGAMHLNDALGKNKDLHCIYNHHEQPCAMAAESYARLTGRIAAVCVTSGPGGTNAITGVLGGWLDSIPMLILSGQVRYDTTVRSTGLHLRQLGDQEFDISACVSTMTKYSVMVTVPNEIRYHLEKALFLARNGRPGPCWLDIPLNVQAALIDENLLLPYDPHEDCTEVCDPVSPDTVLAIIDRIRTARRPVLFAGTAIRGSGATEDFLRLVASLGIPVVTAFNAHDCITSDNPLCFGRPGTIGDRAGNYIFQNSDLLLILGCRMNMRQIGYYWESVARESYKIMVDIDSEEFKKPSFKPDMCVHADCAEFITAMLNALPSEGLPPQNDWLDWCNYRKDKYPVVLKEYWQRNSLVNPYCFMDTLSDCLAENEIIVTANATACIVAFQVIQIKKGQRLYSNSGSAPMGYDLPAAIGACIGANRQRVICLAGDGSIQMNLQELETIVHNNLPVKIFLLNNHGYHSIRQTQTNFFGMPLVGCEPENGVGFPDMEKIACAYGIPFLRCENHSSMLEMTETALERSGPFICEIMLTPDQPFAPRSSSKKLADGKMISRPLEDLAPFLDREEYKSNMIIDIIPE